MIYAPKVKRQETRKIAENQVLVALNLPEVAQSSPIRTCIACRSKKNQRDLIRITWDPRSTCLEGRKSDSIKAQGRGTYVCQSIRCISDLQKANKIERALRKKFDQSQVIELLTKLKTCYDLR